MTESFQGTRYGDAGAVVVAAGVGWRFGDPAKILREIAGKPVYLWAVDACAAVCARVTVVTRPEFEEAIRSVLSRRDDGVEYVVAPGGKRRQDSVAAGLRTLRDTGTKIVVIQDAARPLTRPGLVAATIDAARRCGAGVAARPMADTVKEADGDGMVVRTLDRSRLWSVETPQTFLLESIETALAKVRADGAEVTDDAAAVERAGGRIRLVDSTPWGANGKITVADDLPWIEHLLRLRSADG